MKLQIPQLQTQKTSRNLSQKEKRVLAKKRWNVIKLHVFQGTFHVTAITTNPLDQSIETLWKDILDHCEDFEDTTVEFMQNKGMSLPMGPQQRRNQRRAGVVELVFKEEKLIQDVKQSRSRQVLERQWGLEGQSLDRVPHCDVNNHLFTISLGLSEYSQDILIPTTKQINLNRGWKLLLIGLCQAEPFARYEALTFVQRSLPSINNTLQDSKTKSEIGKRILEIAKGDERKENRTRGLYVLGEYLNQMGNSVEMHPLLKEIILVLVRDFTTLVLHHKIPSKLKKDDTLKIHLLKTIQNVLGFTIHGCQVNSVMMYLMYLEIKAIFDPATISELKPPKVDLFVLLGILDLLVSLNHQQHEDYLGALFLPFITHCQSVGYKPITKKTLEFVCKFLPVTKEESLKKGIEVIMNGIKELKKMGGFGECGADDHFWNRELREWQEKHHNEQIRISLHQVLIRKLLQPPGTVAKLYPISGCNGFFGEMETGMRKAESILVDFPVHAKSFLNITRVVGQIPGVPAFATTTPPLIIAPPSTAGGPASILPLGGLSKVARSQYEYREQIGLIPGLPSGYTYSPGTPVKQKVKTSSAKGGAGWTDIYRVMKADEWEEGDDIPAFATRYPLPVRQLEEGSCPYGFLLVCPYPGFDPDRVEKLGASPVYGKMMRNTFGGGATIPLPGMASTTQTPSVGAMGTGVAGKDKVYYQEYTNLCMIDDGKKTFTVPDNHTVNRHPVLFPCKLPGLKPAEPEHEFLPRSPVIFDLIQPHQPKLRRILCIVEKVDGESSNIVVQKGTGDVGGLYVGASFTMYVKVRTTQKWYAVQLKVLDEDFDDGLDLSSTSTATTTVNHQELAKRSSFASAGSDIYTCPVPVNYTQQGEPFFSPPVNIPPIPVGYNQYHVPYFGKTPSLKSHPLGISVQGNRYYEPSDRKFTPTEVHKHQFAGFDGDGQPFFVPRGTSIPAPSGFTIDGIPFYDISSLIRTQGVFALPSLLRGDDREPSEEEVWTDLGRLLHNTYSGSQLEHKRLENYFVSCLIKNVEGTQPLLKRKLDQARTRLLNPFARSNTQQGFSPPDDIIQEPIEISEFLRNSLSFAHLRSHLIRIVLEPAQCDFHSAKAPITKNFVLRFKAGRGDYTEREYFLAVEPANVFSIRDFNLRLQGEGFHEIAVTFYPLAMKAPVTEGGLHVFDRYGRKMAHSKLVAIRKHFFRVHADRVDLGWVPIHKKKESVVVIENLTEYQISVNVGIRKDSVFLIPNAVLKLRPNEVFRMAVYFAPKALGTFTETVSLIGPSGEESIVTLVGTTDTPVSVLAEDESTSRLGLTFLSMERSSMVRKWSNRKDDLRVVTGSEQRLIDKIQKSVWDPEIKKELLTVDFGICCVQDKPATRCLTVFNWGKEAITVSMFPHDPTITCPYLIRVAGSSASTVELVFNFNSPKLPNRGNYTSAIELSCHGSENIVINVQAYVGQPVFFPLYENAFFKPCRLGQSTQIATHMVNESQYEITCFLEGIDDKISTFQEISSEKPLVIAPFALAPVTFVYRPEVTGPILNTIKIQIIKPNRKTVTGSLRDKDFNLIGICIQPRKPNEELAIHPIAEKLIQWINQTRGNKVSINFDQDFFDDLNDALHIPPEEQCDVIFKSDPFVTEVVGDFGTINTLMAQNRSTVTKKVRFFASPGFTLEPRQKELGAGELIRVDHFYHPPPQVGNLVTVYGFGCLMNLLDSRISSTQIIKRLGLGFMLLPAQNYSDQSMVFEFGRTELTTTEGAEYTRYLMLCNPFNARYSWSIKMAPSARKNLGFEIPVVKGELGKFDTFCVPFKFKIDVSGSFETKCDIFIDPLDQINKSIRLGTIVLKGTAVYTKLYGLPDAIEFGSTIVYHSAKKRINLQNEGSSELEIVILARSPYSVHPDKFSIPAKSNQWIEVIFNPTEHKTIESLIQVFANQMLYPVNVVGTGGAAQLVCEQYSENPVDFGTHKDGTIGWTDIYLTNKGTIPLKAIAVMSDQPQRVRVEFNGIVTNFPGEDQSKITSRKDFWSVVRKKVRVLPYLTQFAKHISIKRTSVEGTHSKLPAVRNIIEVHDVLECDPFSTGLLLPNLNPSVSYHFRIGFPISAKEQMEREVTFSYIPLCDVSDPSELQNLIENTSVELTGNVYVPLQIKTTHLQFGLVPAEAHQNRAINSASKRFAKAQTREALSVRNVKIFNRADYPQVIQLDRLSPEFTVFGRIWTIKPEELLEIPVEFHPPREQTQYLGEVVFSHKHGLLSVKLDGTGASAELVCDEVVDFGNLKLNTTGIRTFAIYNRGILPCAFEMDLVQTEEDFWFNEGDPYEYEAEIAPGKSLLKEICCKSRRKGGSSGHIGVKWKRIPNGKLEISTIPLKLLIGYPEFKIENPELDFKATFIGINKTLPIRVTNDGNAACNWQAVPELTTMSIDIVSGVLEPGDSAILLVTYTPTEFEVLDGGLSFITDAGTVKLVCFGEVGVPYLKIDEKFRNNDFGVVSVGRSHDMSIQVVNTGREAQEFEIKWLSMSRDSVPCEMEDLEFYFVEPTHAVIPPGESLSLKVTVFAKDYAVCYEAEFCIFTIIGEQHHVKLKAIGGQAIVHIQAPRLVKGDPSRNIATPNIEKRKVAKKLGAGAIPVKEMEVTKVLMKSHIDNLYSVVAGLRTAEEELKHTTDTSLSVTQKSKEVAENSKQKAFKVRPFGEKENQPHSKAFLDTILKIENELEEAISRLDPTGSLSAEKIMSQSERSQTAPSSHSSNSTPSSQSSSRSFGQYRPGRRLIRRSQNRSQVGTAPSSSEKPLTGVGSTESSVKPLTGVASSQSGSIGSNLASQGQIETFDGLIALGPEPTDGTSRPTSKADGVRVGLLDPLELQPEAPGREAPSQKPTRRHGKVKLDKIELPKREITPGYIDPITGPNETEAAMEERLQTAGSEVLQDNESENDDYYPENIPDGEKGHINYAKTKQKKADNQKSLKAGQNSKDVDSEHTPVLKKEKKKFDAKLLDQDKLKSTEGQDEQQIQEAAKIAITDVKQSQADFTELLSLAQKLGISIDVAKENMDSLLQVNYMITTCMENTKDAIKTAKGTLLQETWIPNREVIQQALKKLQISTKAIESILKGKLQDMHPEEEDIQSTVYSLDLICGGDRSPANLLFCIPNEGNIPFSYSIEPIKEDCHIPAESANLHIDFFSIDNPAGVLKPGESVDISASFMGFATGHYRQGFVLKSGDDEIMTFTLLGEVGNPILQFATDIIDFGLIAKGQTISKQINFKNSGTFKGSWDLNIVTEGDVPDKVFQVNPNSGKTDPQCESTVIIAFTPSKEISYNAHLELVWKDGPTRIALAGIGGGSKLEFIFDTPEEQQMNGIDFGTTLVGLKYERFVTLKNVGTLGTTVQLSHPNRALVFQVERDEFGDLKINPGQTTRVKVIYSPEKIEKLKDLIAFTLGNPRTSVQSISVKGKSQTQSWEIEGELDFMNLKVGESQEKILVIKNTGTSNISLDMRFEPPFIEKYFEINFDGWHLGTPIPPEKSFSFRFFTHADSHELVEGSVVFKSKILNQPKTKRFPVFYRFFTDEVIAKITEDVDLGRAVEGEKLKATQVISNHGNKKIRYRARLETDSAEPTDWKIENSVGFGTLNPNESIEINAIFDAISGRGDAWQQARLVIEKTNLTDDDWTTVSDVGLKAALGIAQFLLEPTAIDFGEVGVGAKKTSQIWIKNPGTAVCLYQITNELTEGISLVDFPVIGTIAPDSQLPLTIEFSPTKAAEYTFDIEFKTSVGNFMLTIYGKSLDLKLHTDSLPKFIDFDKLLLNQLKSVELDIENDCVLDLDVDISIISTITNEPSSAIRIQPFNSIVIPRNSADGSRKVSSLELTCGIVPLVDSFGCMVPSFESFPFGERQTETLIISNKWKTFEYRAPVYYKISVAPLSFKRSLESTAQVDSVDFGSTNLENGAIKKLYITNPNPFKFRGILTIESQGTNQFVVYPENEIEFETNVPIEITIVFEPMDTSVYPDALPKSTAFESILKLKTNLAVLPPLIVPLLGTLVDKSEEIDLPTEIDFGPIFSKKLITKSFEIYNPSRRSLHWKFYVEPEFADVFIVNEPKDGNIPSKSRDMLSMTFKPHIGVAYQSTAYFVLEDKVTTIELYGTGVEPTLNVEYTDTNFGVVGITDPEYREITVHNPTPLKMRVQPQSDNPDFLPVETEVELAPGETRKIKVLFRPKETSGVQVGKLTLYQLSEGGDVNALTEIVNVQWQKNTGKGSSNNVLNTQDDVVFEGRGGKFGFNVSGDVETLAENIPEMDPKLDNVQLSKIQMRFNRIATGKTVRKMFEVENSGDTILEFATYDLDHEAIDDETTYHSKNGFFNYTISPSVSRIMPKTKEKVMVVLEAKKDGTDEFGFFVKTKNLIRNKVVQVQVSATIYTPTDMDNLRAFVRADDNLETKYDLKAQEERYAMTDLHLWKVLSPIVRISSKKASEEMVYIQPVQPNVSRVEIGPFVVRPPAIPETQAPKNKKWYTNRISMAVDKLNKEVDMPRPSEEKREQMIQFLARSKVEKNVVLDKKNK